MAMIGAPAWIFGDTWHPTFVPQLPRPQIGAEGLGRERIPGGRAAGRNPMDFDQQQLAIGTRVELEHTPNALVAREIAMDHLVEDPMYYTKLAQVHLDGLGITRARWTALPSGLGPSHELSGFGITRARWKEQPSGLGPSHPLEGMNELFDSFWWRNRKWAVLGGVGLLGLAGLALAGAVLR